MKKLFRLISLAAILCVVYLLFTTPRGDAAPAMKVFDKETGDVTDQVKDIGQEAVKQADEVIGDAVRQADEAIGDAVKQADEAIGNAVEQADKALADAVDSAAQGAKQGFIESLKESMGDFWENVFRRRE